MFMNVGYTPPPPTWPPKTKTAGMGLYLPQAFVTPQRLVAALQSARIQVPQGWGMGDCGCGCGGTCDGKDHAHGMGLFDSGSDTSGWGLPEWGIIGLGAIGLISFVNSVMSGGKAVRKSYRRRSRARKKAALKKELS